MGNERSMKYQFRNEVAGIKKAAMGEMFQLAKENLDDKGKIINFASGHPDTEMLQDNFIRKYISMAIEKFDLNNFEYEVQGYGPLLYTLKEFVNQKGYVIKSEDDVMVTYGSTEAVYLTASALVGYGDKVIVENPSYVNAIKAFQLLGAEIIGVHMEEDGVNIDELEKIIKYGGVSLFYTIPNFGNPSGITMSYKKRKAVYELAKKYHVPILEDNIYGELRYRGERLPNIKEFDTEGVVIYVGSVSKVIAPAMRIGYIAANKKFIKHVILLKEASTNGILCITQYALWKMLKESDIYDQIQKIRDVYAKKLFLMEESMDKYFPKAVRHSLPDGGMYIWVTLPEGSDVQRFCEESAIQLHIAITPGNEFCVMESEKCTSMRFNFVKESLEDIAYGIERVGNFMRVML